MPYVTVRQAPRSRQITLEEILMGTARTAVRRFSGSPASTVTHLVEYLSPELRSEANIPGVLQVLSDFCNRHATLIAADKASLYHSFHIPKKSGTGLRRIDQPCPELMEALRQLKTIMENDMSALYHTSAYAYVQGRCTIDAVKKHQKNQSRWFLKLDFENFFGSTTLDFLLSMLSQVYPFNFFTHMPAFSKAIDLCFLNGGLPQGTPISPLLTNLMMIPIDHVICNELAKRGFVYTRYADDIIISSRYSFSFAEISQYVDSVLKRFGAPFNIKASKTRYGSSSGQNWNLGVMLNKDNKITIGRKKKERFKAMCHNYVTSKQQGEPWSREEVQSFSGQISYYKMVEPDYIQKAIGFYNEKFGVNLMRMIRDDLR